MPVWAAIAVALAAFTLRSILRGLDFTPDLPIDAVVVGALLLLLLLVAWVRADDARRDEEATNDEDPENPNSARPA